MTAAASRIAQFPTVRPWKPLQHTHLLTTSQPLTSPPPPPPPPPPPHTTALKPPGADPTSAHKPREDGTRLGAKLESVGEGHRVHKRPRGRGGGHKRGKKGPRAGSVRLVSADGLSNRGRVEIFVRGEWGTVCDDLFTSKAGGVVCRQLGFAGALAVMKRAALGEADRSVGILLDDVECEGGERSLLECKRSRVGKHNCSHGEDVGVICA